MERITMRFDMHCHTKEGSLDGKIHLADYVALLKEKGYQGMLITDHNSYQAYRYYKKHKEDPAFQDFTILKGIEYDTIDAGHVLVIMPEYRKLPILELRGLPVSILIEIVHFFGGILGPAHPCGEKYLSLCNTRRYRKNPRILKEFDFMEVFNACEPPTANEAAAELAQRSRLPGFGGSDAHKHDCVGSAYTEVPDGIVTESDLIRYIRDKKPVSCGGSYYHGTTRERIGSLNNILVYSFWFYNKAAGLRRYHKRRLAFKDYKKESDKNRCSA
nr:CehA/McbA family metallohydrolase [uncultured Acetatifactor sp.]